MILFTKNPDQKKFGAGGVDGGGARVSDVCFTKNPYLNKKTPFWGRVGRGG